MLEEGSSGCFNFTREEFKAITLTKDVLCGISLLACCTAVLLIVLIKSYTLFVHRLSLYLIIATFFNSLTFILMSVPVTYNDQLKRTEVKNNSDSRALCKATGFLIQYVGWVVMLLVTFISLYLLLLALGKLSERAQKFKYEVTVILVSLLLPTTFNWIPFVSNLYGLAGPWCWIEIGRSRCPTHFDKVVIYQFVLYYIPALLLAGLNSIAIVTIIVILCKNAWHSRHNHEPIINQRQYKDAIKEAVPPFIVAVVYTALYSLSFTNRIVQTIVIGAGERPVASLWITHAVTFSILQLLIPLGFILHPRNISCKELRKGIASWQKKSECTTEFVASLESSVSEALVIRGRSGNPYQQGQRVAMEILATKNKAAEHTINHTM